MKRLVRRDLQTRVDVASPLLSRLFSARGVACASEVDHRLAHLLTPETLKGLPAAVDLLTNAIDHQARILIVGDFDADGATSCVLMMKGLKALGADHVDYLVPNRFEYGYGLTPEIVEVARGFDPTLIITVDNGISSVQGAEHARSLGIKLLITDHHLPGKELPPADAIVNPNQGGCDFASKNLAGVGVAFYVLSALRARLRESGWFERHGVAEPNLGDYLDLVALGTIADVVPLDYNNRILVQEGLRRIRSGKCRPGLLAMIDVAGLRREKILSRDLAFGIAPRLNAAGRLKDISLGIECLLADTHATASALADELDTLNKQRRDIEDEMRAQALDVNDESSWVSGKDAVGVCLFHNDWHQGVVGIVASRIKERVHRPVIAFARAGELELKGSARSITGLHVRDAIDSIAAQYPGLVTKFGGHAMAAGLSLAPDKLDQFARAFDTEARKRLSTQDLEEVVLSDGELDEPLTVQLVRVIEQAAPWGQGFTEPLFDGEFEVLEQRIVGGHHLKLRLARRGDPDPYDAIAFNHPGLIEGRYRRLAYRPMVNEYRGRESVQLVVVATDLTVD
ncbi:MAG: single-stranded-DNA-specific exonuclease RecJ [Pseudomonadales bacterium]